MITIFCDFRQFSAKKLAFFSKTNVMITIFAKTSSILNQKRHFFANFFGENILKIITSVPDGRMQKCRKVTQYCEFNLTPHGRS
jgi:hypothetical protein